MTAFSPQLPKSAAPRHVAVIMDGNGRWAKQRFQPRALGHRAGVRSARKIVRAAHRAGVEVLTLFAFSQENWRRPPEEVSLLMQLFIKTLAREIDALHRNGVRIRFIGDHRDFAPELREEMARAEQLTLHNSGLVLVIAVGYGGQWDIAQAAQRLAALGRPITAEAIEEQLDTAGLPLPDLLIRTGGERRISNFLLWQLAYTELFFSDTLWPDFSEAEFNAAVAWFAGRERRFGRVPEST
ncbi:MAG: di-trans,poly-cis-decaprenylcistransferase [Nevskiaceae bacterium]|nr:MAG: di-trans,poly-cis-decaprenylcistransferase [Nevskiaceae bacterium]